MKKLKLLFMHPAKREIQNYIVDDGSGHISHQRETTTYYIAQEYEVPPGNVYVLDSSNRLRPQDSFNGAGSGIIIGSSNPEGVGRRTQQNNPQVNTVKQQRNNGQLNPSGNRAQPQGAIDADLARALRESVETENLTRAMRESREMEELNRAIRESREMAKHVTPTSTKRNSNPMTSSSISRKEEPLFNIQSIPSCKYTKNKEQIKDDENEDACVVCTEKQPNAIFSPCAHRCCCLEDARKVLQTYKKCPLCRSHIDEIIPTR